MLPEWGGRIAHTCSWTFWKRRGSADRDGMRELSEQPGFADFPWADAPPTSRRQHRRMALVAASPASAAASLAFYGCRRAADPCRFSPSKSTRTICRSLLPQKTITSRFSSVVFPEWWRNWTGKIYPFYPYSFTHVSNSPTKRPWRQHPRFSTALPIVCFGVADSTAFCCPKIFQRHAIGRIFVPGCGRHLEVEATSSPAPQPRVFDAPLSLTPPLTHLTRRPRRPPLPRTLPPVAGGS